MESDKAFLDNCIERLEMKPFINENKFIESLIPFFDVMMQCYYYNEDSTIFSNLISNFVKISIPDKIFKDNLEYLLPIAHSDVGEDYLQNFMFDTNPKQ